jgi:hypothetical protein
VACASYDVRRIILSGELVQSVPTTLYELCSRLQYTHSLHTFLPPESALFRTTGLLVASFILETPKLDQNGRRLRDTVGPDNHPVQVSPQASRLPPVFVNWC